MDESDRGVRELLVSFPDVYGALSVLAMLIPGNMKARAAIAVKGLRGKHHIYPELSCPWIHSPAIVSAKDVGSTGKEVFPYPFPSSPLLPTAAYYLSGACPSNKEREGSRSGRQDKRVEMEALRELSALGRVAQGRELGWVT